MTLNEAGQLTKQVAAIKAAKIARARSAFICR